MIGAAGVGKTANFLYLNIEYACASGMSWLCTDTKEGSAIIKCMPRPHTYVSKYTTKSE